MDQEREREREWEWEWEWEWEHSPSLLSAHPLLFVCSPSSTPITPLLVLEMPGRKGVAGRGRRNSRGKHGERSEAR